MDKFLASLDDEIEDADEETFYLFSQSQSSRDLGMVDGKATELGITIGDRDFTIKQSPGVLQSDRDGGTTGAAVWECSVRFAEWLSSAKNSIFDHGVLDSTSTVLELGAGISGLVPLMLGPRVKRVVATDQQYALPLLRANIEDNTKPAFKARKGATSSTYIQVKPLDWEADDFPSTFRSYGFTTFDAIVACDCVFNYALIEPFVQACIEACKYGRNADAPSESMSPAVCVVAQQLRQPDVFQQWLDAFSRAFRVWRISDEGLTEKLKEGSEFVVHLGVLQ